MVDVRRRTARKEYGNEKSRFGHDTEGNLSLDGVVLRERAKEVKLMSVQLARQRALIREQRRRVRVDAEAIRRDELDFADMEKPEWLNVAAYLPGKKLKRVRMNVGQHMFEASERILRSDPESLLSTLCDGDCSLKADSHGVFHIDRDWWIFRFVLKFLRYGVCVRTVDVGTTSRLGIPASMFFSCSAVVLSLLQYFLPQGNNI